jgi:Zn finger protein HypA/HybF involved in hydrogenase expression
MFLEKGTVNVRLSPFSYVAAESLQESFKEFKGKVFEKILLNILPLELPLERKNCKRRVNITTKLFNRLFCGSADVSIQMDKEFLLNL